MNPTPPVPSTPPPTAKKRGLFAFFFKSALGCTAFAFGVLVMFVLLLPTIASGPVASYAADEFGKRFQGQLEIGNASLAWFSEQKLDRVVVRDPEGHEIVRASAVLPALVTLMQSSGGKFGRVSLELDADLVQDDAGVTNLQRALEQKKPTTPSANASESSGDDPLALLAKLELDLVVKSKKLTWSDRETRRIGIPFEVRDLDASVKARPGAPILVHAVGKIVSEQPGALAVDATLGGPIDARKSWPFGKVDASVRVEGFSTAMVDGMANLGGNLVEVLGKRFTLTATANGATSNAGNVEVALDGERAGLALVGRFEDGVLRSGEKAGFVATFPAPRGFLKQYVDANLPSGTTLALDAGTKPWTITAKSFAIPLPPSGATDLASLAPTLERAALDMKLEVPSQFAFENEFTRAGGVKLSVRTIQANVRLLPGEPLVARVEAALDSGREGSVVVDVSARDAWKKLGAGALPVVDLEAKVTDLATAALGALAGQSERMTAALGSTLSLDVEARNVSLEAGTLRASVVGHEGTISRSSLTLAARVAGGQAFIDGENRLRVALSPSAEWLAREIAAVSPAGTDIVVDAGQDAITLEATDVVVPMPDPKGGDFMAALKRTAAGSITLRVAGASYADAILKAAKTRISTSGIDATAKLAPGGGITLTARGDFRQGPVDGKFVVDASAANAFAFADSNGALPPIDARVVVTNLPAGLVDAFVQHQNVVERTLGDKFSLALDAQGASATSGTLRLALDAPNAKIALGGRIDGGTFRATGEDVLHAELRVRGDVLRDELAAFMPAETVLKWPNDLAAITCDARDVSVALPKPGSTQAFDLGAMLDGVALRVNLTIAGVGFENARTRQLKIDAAASDIAIEATLAPAVPLALKLRANMSPGRDARLEIQATLADPFAIVKGAALKPIDGRIELTGLDTNVLDALAGQDGTISGLLGNELRVVVEAKNASLSSGALVVDAASPAMSLHASARFDDAGLHMDGRDGLDVRLTPSAEFVEARLAKLLPAGTRLRLASDAGPLTLALRDVSVPMPKANEASTALQTLSKLAFKLEAAVPGLVYSDAATDAAQRPVSVTGVRLQSTFAPGAQPFATLSGTIVDEPPGEITADIRALDPLTKLNETGGLDTFRAKIDVRATRVPTALVDVLARQDGLLVETLGARLDLTVSAPEIALSSGAFQIDVHSEQHGVKGKGHLEKGAIVIDEVDGLVAVVGLGPVMSKRVVGKLVPTLVNVSKPETAAPAKFSVDALRFPLDGDLRKLDGIVRIDLGEVNYALFPELSSFFNDKGGMSSTKIPVLTVPITKGVAGYQRLPVRIGDREYIFSGTYDIVNDAAQLTANVPVNLLGKKVSAELEKLREYIDPSITVPLTIRGSLVKPSIGVDDKALLKVIKDAGAKALEGAAGGLLDDLLKKKKKKD